MTAIRPRGFEQVYNFYETRRIPLGSWHEWLQECYRCVSVRYKFNCTWSTLVGMTAGMLAHAHESSRKEFCEAVRASFKRTDTRRFLCYFVLLSHLLAANTDSESKGEEDDDQFQSSIYLLPTAQDVQKTYRLILRCNFNTLPRSPCTFQPRHLQLLQQYGATIPKIDNDAEFVATLQHGFFIASRDESCAKKLALTAPLNICNRLCALDPVLEAFLLREKNNHATAKTE